MIVFKLGFLLAFSTISNEKKLRQMKSSKKSQKDKKHGKSSSKSKSSLKSKKSSSKSKTVSSKSKEASSKSSIAAKKRKIKEPVELPRYVLDVGNPVGYAHIEFQLGPEYSKQLVDVVYWKDVAKILVGDDAITYRVPTTETKIWVPIFMQIVANVMTIDQLEDFHKYPVYFHIYANAKKVGVKAKAVKTTQFFLREDDIESDNLVVPVYDINPNVIQNVPSKAPTIKFIESLITSCVYSPASPTELVVKLTLPDPVQNTTMKMIIDKTSKNEEIFCKDYIPVAEIPVSSTAECQQKKKKTILNNRNENLQKNTKNSKKLSQKEGKGDYIQIKASAEIFFTDPTISIFDSKNTIEKIPNAYVLLGVEKLLTNKQKFVMNPMVVKIGKLENLDVERLTKANFKSVFVRYVIPNTAVVTTKERNIARNIRFSEAHAHFTNIVPSVSITEYIQSNRLFIEICGVREVTKNIQPSIFGTKYDDKYFGQRMTPIRYILNLYNDGPDELEPIEVLAVAAYDLTSLLTPVWNYTCKESCHHPDNLLYQQPHQFSQNLALTTTNNINIKEVIRTKSRSPLSEFSLVKNGTSLQLQVYFMAPLTHITNNIYYRCSCYNRMLIIVYSINLAATLLNDIVSYNQGNISKEIIIPDLSKCESCFFQNVEEYLSGFIIDDGGSFAFFLEGVFEHKIRMLWQNYRQYPAEEIIIYFNSDCVFEERLYTAFSEFRGFCIITLQKPLRDIISQEAFYVEGNVPLPCWQAAKKLDILFRATTIKDILQYNLLPSPEELLSLNMEWGIPMRWKDVLETGSVTPKHVTST